MTLYSRAKGVPFLLAIVLLFPASVSAQARLGRIVGTVKDSSGASISGAVVTARSSKGATVTVTTDDSGTYELRGLLTASYNLSVRAKGFETHTQALDVAAGQSQRVDVSLTIARLEDKIEVRDQGPGKVDIDPAGNGGAIVLKEKELEWLADDPDELANQLRAIAGPAAGSGSTQFYVDGFSGQRLPPKSAIREVRINQDPYSAEYDTPGFARIDVFTKPGSQRFAGLVSYRFNDARFNSTSPFLSKSPAYNTQMLSGDFGGPLTNKSSFLFGIDHNRINDNAAVSALILDPHLNRIQFDQAVTNPRIATLASFRVDYQARADILVFARYQYFGKNETNDGVGQFSLSSQGFNLNSVEQTFQASVTLFLSPKVINETRFQYLRVDSTQTVQSSAPQVSVPGAFTSGGSSLGNAGSRQDHYELQDHMSRERGNQLLKFGGRFRYAAEADGSRANFNGTFVFPSLNAFQITEQGLRQGLTPAQIRAAGGGAEQFSITAGRPAVSNNLFDAGLFLQDDWKVRPNLTLGLGLRYEVQDGFKNHGNLAPRIGFAWGIHPGKKHAPKSVLRVGWGVFYTRIGQSLLLQTAQLNGVNQRQFIVKNPDFFPAVPSTGALESSAATPTIYTMAPNIRAPYVMQTSVSFERSLPRSSKVAITYLNSRGVHDLVSANINAPLPGTFNVNTPGSGKRPFPGAGNLYQFESAGKFEQNQLTVNFKTDSLARFFRFNGAYTLNYANSNTSGASSFLSNPFDIGQDYGRASYDIRHRLYLGGRIDLPLGLYADTFLLFASGRPFNITIGRDINGDSILNDRPSFATDLLRRSVVKTAFGAFDTEPIPGQAIIPSNFGAGPANVTFNIRLAKAFALGSKEVRAPAESSRADKGKRDNIYKNGWHPLYGIRFELVANNVFNHVSLAAPVGTLSSPLFGRSTSLAGSPYSSTSAGRQIFLRAVFRF
jgi:hypothetical protein